MKSYLRCDGYNLKFWVNMSCQVFQFCSKWDSIFRLYKIKWWGPLKRSDTYTAIKLLYSKILELCASVVIDLDVCWSMLSKLFCLPFWTLNSQLVLWRQSTLMLQGIAQIQSCCSDYQLPSSDSGKIEQAQPTSKYVLWKSCYI